MVSFCNDNDDEVVTRCARILCMRTKSGYERGTLVIVMILCYRFLPSSCSKTENNSGVDGDLFGISSAVLPGDDGLIPVKLRCDDPHFNCEIHASIGSVVWKREGCGSGTTKCGFVCNLCGEPEKLIFNDRQRSPPPFIQPFNNVMHGIGMSTMVSILYNSILRRLQ